MRFECQTGCTACCTQQGFINLTEDDARRIAAHLGMTRRAFEKRHVYTTANRRRLRRAGAGHCPFLHDGGCTIHTVKPTQCRLFPYWPELVNSKREWLKTARYCPGIGKGPLVRIESARELAREMREAYPKLYG